MRRLFLFTMLVLVWGAGEVQAQHVTVDFNKDTDFAKYKTYKWVPIASAQQLDELTSGQLMGTVEVELAKKGLKQTQSDPPDLLIGYQIASAKQTPNYAIGGSYGSTGGGNMGAGAAATVHSGLLVLDLYDAGSKQLVWRGVVANSIEPNAKPDKKQKHMSEAVEKLLKKYPPEKKS